MKMGKKKNLADQLWAKFHKIWEEVYLKETALYI